MKCIALALFTAASVTFALAPATHAGRTLPDQTVDAGTDENDDKAKPCEDAGGTYDC